MARCSGAARRAALLLAAAALLAGLGGAAALDPDEQAVQQMLRGMLEVAEEINTGKEVESRVSAMAAPANLDSVNASDIQAKLFASAVVTWQLGVWDSPYNKGLIPKKMLFYDLVHYYQVPEKPIGTLVMFHGCYHDASGSWPYHPKHCRECLGLPEEALAHGFAVLAVESRNRSRKGRCFSSGTDPMTSDQWTAPYTIQNFLYETGLQNLPVYTLGISAGAAFATKVIKNFWDPNFGGIIKPAGIISEVNAPSSWRSWGLEGKDGKLKFPDFPPVAFIAMERDNRTFNRILDRIQDLRRFNVPADYIMVKSRPVDRLWFYNRSPVITARQSAEIVRAMKRLGFLDADGNLKYDPRIGALTDNNPLAKWNRKLVGRVDWLHMSPSKAPMLSVLSDRSTIFEEMNVAWAYHEGVADHMVPCLMWLRSGGELDLKYLARKLGVDRLRDLTMKRVHWKPPPPPPRPSAKRRPPPPPKKRPPPPAPRKRPPPQKKARRAME
ncbi:hypothetical protein CHLNCDRAFT_57065 [Chlorella variabilis]|uniref:Uncharacterized protein n=1 Tax=Chlorella variabilis TaxID=554065 RepID=E1Z7U3_CHLVA|nr:hypothetical protein CHLNCDRAFT_57065 [Chlorella variabilis]EFN58232.1 hypothetical protein CHLNCDRAFT_57065 [Chlorella variabilis]|eukprot:XP_005850334.1 hypothetical protein CHLNCDRAFT_57065 [Chlorella variabilis]